MKIRAKNNKLSLTKTKNMSNLFNRLQEGDKEALKEVFEMYYDLVFNYINSRIQNYHDAQDLTSETFIAFFQSVKNFQGNSSIKNYLFGIIKNKIKDYLKAKKLDYNTVLFSDLPFDLNDESNDLKMLGAQNRFSKFSKVLDYIIKALTPRYAAVLNLRYKQMYTTIETARKLNISLNNLKVLEHRAIKKAALIWRQLDNDVKKKFISK